MTDELWSCFQMSTTGPSVSNAISEATSDMAAVSAC